MNEELKVIISAEVTKFKKGVAEAKDSLNGLKQEAGKAKEALGKVWNGVGEGATKASKAIVGSVAGVATALTGTAALTAEYREAQAKLNAAFETAGASAETAKTTYNDLYRVLGDGDVAVEAANHLAKLTTEEKALQEWTNICQGVYATFGDSLPIEGLTEAANETAKVGSLTGSLADALNWAGVNEDEFQAKLDACNTEQEREALIRQTLTGLYDEAAKNYEKTAKSTLAQNEAQAKLTESLAKLGESMTPVLTAFTDFASEALAVVVPYVQELAEKYTPKLEQVLKKVATALKPIAEFISKNLPLIAGVAGTILGIATAYKTITAAMTAYNAVKTAYTTITTLATAAQTAFTTATLASAAPILAVVAAITAVIAIIAVCIKNWDKISETVTKVCGKMKELVTGAVSVVKEKFEALKTGISEKLSSAKTIVSEKFSAIKETMSEKMASAKETVGEKLVAIKESFSEKLSSAKTTVSSILDSIKKKFTDIMDGAKNIVKTAIEKIKGFFNFKWELPKIKLPHFSITGSFSLNPPSIPKFSVDWYAKGGVFDNPTLFGYGGRIGGLGEAGAEAIVPLENNLAWLDKLASMLSDRMGGSNQPIILQVDGKTFAEIAVDSINDLTRQRGSLPLRLI